MELKEYILELLDTKEELYKLAENKQRKITKGITSIQGDLDCMKYYAAQIACINEILSYCNYNCEIERSIKHESK